MGWGSGHAANDPRSAVRAAVSGSTERVVPNLHRAYADAGIADVDVVAALTDALVWAGHPMRAHV